MSRVFLKCGCSANALQEVNNQKVPSCVIHGVTEQIKTPDLTNRKAKCNYGCPKSIRDSCADLAFFQYEHDKEYDSFYCGCYGWD